MMPMHGSGTRPTHLRTAMIASSLMLVVACRASRRSGDPQRSDASTPRDVAERPPMPSLAPSRVAEGSQPRWRYLARGARPRGNERWRYDLTPREASGEPATDGQTVFIAAARTGPEGGGDGEVFAFDLAEGTLRWHTPVGGLHGEPVELAEGLVLVDTLAHCASRDDEGAELGAHACRDARPGGVVALDAITGRERFRTAAASEMLHARWTLLRTTQHRWMHDGSSTLRDLLLPSGALGARMPSPGTVLQGIAVGDELLAVIDLRRTTVLSRRTPGVSRPRWERPAPYRSACAPVLAGPLVVLPGFSARGLAGAPRAFATLDGADRWSATPPPQTVQTCAAAEDGVLWQVRDSALQGNALFDGRGRAGRPLPAAPTSDLTALLDGVFYLSQPRALLGVDVNSGNTSVQLRTDAQAVDGLVLWGGRGVAVTRDPGLVIGFD